jgi:hypothetical protein
VFDASSKTGVVYDERCLLHQADYAHFESPLRMSTTFQVRMFFFV